MNFPKDCQYTKDHEWIKEANHGLWIIGITNYALDQLGDIVHLELPNRGDAFQAGDSFGTIESTKTVSDLYIPIAGTITHINDNILNDVDKLSIDPFDLGWLIKIEGSPKDEQLLSAEEYQKFIEEED